MSASNRLLAALPASVYQNLARQFEQLNLPRGQVLHEPGSTIRHLYFPLTCLVSITVSTRDGRTAETGIVGSREMVGVNAFMGGAETTQTRYVVQVAGDAIKVQARPLLQAFDRNKAVRDVLLRYTQAMIGQISQNAACNRLHDIQQRFARWLLEVRDRVHNDQVHLTQNFIAEMLAVRRASVTDTANTLQRRGIILVRRGGMDILDRRGLSRTACECYAVIRDENDRLLGLP